jgi:hypothetical protein
MASANGTRLCLGCSKLLARAWSSHRKKRKKREKLLAKVKIRRNNKRIEVIRQSVQVNRQRNRDGEN